VADNAEQSVADDAVSNRSDDTLLEDPHVDAPHIDLRAEEPQGDEVAAEDEQAVLMTATDAAVAIDDPATGADDGIVDEMAEEDASESSSRGAIEEDLSEEEIRMDWYILKVQSNRERSIAEALERKIKIEGLDRFFDQVIVPTEKVTEFKAGKKKVVERKLYPGYIVVHMHINDDTWFAVRETSGVGDFTGAGGKPTPMLPHEVSRIVQADVEETSESPKLDIKFSAGDKVKVKEGNFESFEGEVGSIDEASGRVTVMINIFGRSTPVELEYWQIEAV
jgi:transcriptional antiterminator NusG